MLLVLSEVTAVPVLLMLLMLLLLLLCLAAVAAQCHYKACSDARPLLL
jgi:hypothetical protein